VIWLLRCRSSAGLNSSPGLEGIEKATGVDVAEAIVEYIERDLRPPFSRARAPAQGGES
jgi:hypothetical protein